MTQPKDKPEAEVEIEAVPCRSCDTPLAVDQAYCLRCGEPAAGVAPALPREQAPASTPLAAAGPTGPFGLVLDRPLALLIGGGLALLVGGVLFGSAIAGGDVRPAPIRVQVPAAKAPIVNVTAGTPVAEAKFASDWPDKSGWTVQLQTIPKAGATTAAVEAAKSAASSAGAPDVGALDSDQHAALDGGEYIIYSKVYRTKRQATAAARKLSKNFPDAKVIKVSAPASSKLSQLEKSSGDDFVKKSRKLPDKVKSEGRPPPKDNAPAGDGDKPETIG